MKILGISAFYHDSAAALLDDGEIVAAAQEERFTRKKHDSSYPSLAIDYCLNEAGLGMGNLDHIVFYDKPLLKFERLLETYMTFAPRGFKSFRLALPLWLKEKLFQKKLLVDKFKSAEPELDWENKLLFAEHHMSHAASAFYPSPFDEAVILTMDGVGEWATTSLAYGDGNQIDMLKHIEFPHSLGLLYSAFTYYTGFRVNSGEYKLMGLAPYGEPKYRELILDNLIDIKPDGSFRLDQSYFDYCTGLRMTSEKFDELFGGPARTPEQELTQRHMDIAASIQSVTEDIVLAMATGAAREFQCKNLCLAGGVALNCVANGKLLKDKSFEQLWIQPAAGDAGGALGAAYCGFHQGLKQSRSKSTGKDRMRGTYLGPRFDVPEIESALTEAGAVFTTFEEQELIERTTSALADGKAVGWFSGKMEFGPRALGGRSILGDPRSPSMQRDLNIKVKFRESFRPFAPSVLREKVSEWFELDDSSPYMLIVAAVKASKCRTLNENEMSLSGLEKLSVPRSDIPAVTHVDYSARVQTVHEDTNERYYRLLKSFEQKTGCPVLINTSFNVRGEPIVCTPNDAFRCFMGTDLDVLVVENCFLEKTQQDSSLALDYKNEFALD